MRNRNFILTSFCLVSSVGLATVTTVVEKTTFSHPSSTLGASSVVVNGIGAVQDSGSSTETRPVFYSSSTEVTALDFATGHINGAFKPAETVTLEAALDGSNMANGAFDVDTSSTDQDWVYVDGSGAIHAGGPSGDCGAYPTPGLRCGAKWHVIAGPTCQFVGPVNECEGCTLPTNQCGSSAIAIGAQGVNGSFTYY